MSIFDEFTEQADIIDCTLELHELRIKVRTLKDEKLIKFVMDWDSKVETDENVQEAIDIYFLTGELHKDNRKIIEDCYVLMSNDLCWGESEEDFGVYHTFIMPK